MEHIIKNLTINDYVKLEEERAKAEEKYFKYADNMPTYALTLIKEVYNEKHLQATRQAQSRDITKDQPSGRVTETIDVLEQLTEIKLLNHLANSFQKGEDSIQFSFTKGKPDQTTAEFFNLSDTTDNILNITRTTHIKLPQSFHSKESCVFDMTPQGDTVTIDGKLFEQTDPFISGNLNEDFIQ